MKATLHFSMFPVVKDERGYERQSMEASLRWYNPSSGLIWCSSEGTDAWGLGKGGAAHEST